jgi:hypothetical protein
VQETGVAANPTPDEVAIVRKPLVQIADFVQAVMETDEEKYDSEPAVN